MFGRCKAAQQSNLPIHGHDGLEVILFGDGNVDDVASIVSKMLGGREDLLGDRRIRVDPFLEDIARARAMPELVA
jgi:hypothetical protein